MCNNKLIPYWLCYYQYHFSMWFLNCSDCSDISSACHTIRQLAAVAKHVACSIQDAAIWLVEVTLAANSRKGELTLNSQGQIWNLLYCCHKWSNCHETKSKPIHLTLGLKCDPQVWLWPWPWPWIFKVKYWICYISANKSDVDVEIPSAA